MMKISRFIQTKNWNPITHNKTFHFLKGWGGFFWILRAKTVFARFFLKDDFSTNSWATHMIFSPGKKWENIFWNPKVFYPPFQKFLGYFVNIFFICESEWNFEKIKNWKSAFLLTGGGVFFLDLARENRFRALIFERRFLHEFLSYTYDFFTTKKLRKYILKFKSF